MFTNDPIRYKTSTHQIIVLDRIARVAAGCRKAHNRKGS